MSNELKNIFSNIGRTMIAGGFPILSFSFGLASITGQVALLREFMSLFSGHEIIIGLFLSFWMLLTGAGAILGGKFRKGIDPRMLPVILGLSFVIGVLMLYFLRSVVIVHGAEPELSTLVAIIFVSLLPVCLVTGYAFTRYSVGVYETDGKWSISKVYVWEQLGSSVGGGLLYLLLVQWLDSVKILLVVVFYLFFVAIILSDQPLVKKRIVFGLTFLTGVTLMIVPLQKLLRSLEFKSERIISIKDTPYGNVIVTEADDQINIYENGDLRSYSGDVEKTEEDVHAVLMRHPAPHRALMIGGASSGTFREFRKYRDLIVDYVDADPAVVDLLEDKAGRNVNLFVTDPFRFLKSSGSKYDVIILNAGIPHNLQDNRFYTREFLSVAKAKLNDGGIIGVKGQEKQFHKGDSYVRFLTIIASTGSAVFDSYDVFPGNYIWFLFSDKKILPLFGEVHSDVVEKNLWFNPDYILPDILQNEKDEYLQMLKADMPVNTGLNPVLLEQSIFAKSGYWHIDRYLYVYIVAGLFVVALFFFKSRAKTMAVAGFALSGVQLLLIYLMQIVAGNIYEMIGALFALSMAGMALGGWLHRKYVFRFGIKTGVMLLITGVLILLLPFVMKTLIAGSLLYLLQVLVVYSLVLLFSFAGGVLFSSVSYDDETKTATLAGAVYGADLAGSSVGVLLTSLFFIPIAGMVNTAFLLGIVCVMVGLMMIRI